MKNNKLERLLGAFFEEAGKGYRTRQDSFESGNNCTNGKWNRSLS